MGRAEQGASLETQVLSHFADSARLKQDSAKALAAPIARAYRPDGVPGSGGGVC